MTAKYPDRIFGRISEYPKQNNNFVRFLKFSNQYCLRNLIDFNIARKLLEIIIAYCGAKKLYCVVISF